MLRKKSAGSHNNIILRIGTLLLFGCALCAVLAAVSGLEAGAVGRSGAVFPLQTTAWRLSDGYGMRADPLENGEEFHHGADLACAEGTPVAAAMDGVVLAARRSGSYGNYIRLCHAGGTETVYAHLQYIYVREGEVICAGQALGTVGQTGRATGAHLHFELKVNGAYKDPARVLGL